MHDGRSEHASHTLPNKAYYGIKLCELGIIIFFLASPKSREKSNKVLAQHMIIIRRGVM